MNTYEIRVHSLLDPTWQETFDVETFLHGTEQGETLMRSKFDQAQLQGILNRIHNMGLKLIAVNIVEDDPNDSGNCHTNEIE